MAYGLGYLYGRNCAGFKSITEWIHLSFIILVYIIVPPHIIIIVTKKNKANNTKVGNILVLIGGWLLFLFVLLSFLTYYDACMIWLLWRLLELGLRLSHGIGSSLGFCAHLRWIWEWIFICSQSMEYGFIPLEYWFRLALYGVQSRSSCKMPCDIMCRFLLSDSVISIRKYVVASWFLENWWW